MRVIELTKGFVTIVDDEDYNLVSPYSWYVYTNKNRSNQFYAHHGDWNNDTKTLKIIKMHRLIMGVTDPKVHIDHKDGDGLNNQRYNLRICTSRQNSRNKACWEHTSKYKGVCWRADSKKWRAYITVNYKRKNIGTFSSEAEAAEAYNKFALKYFKEFAKLNDLT